MSSLGPPGPKRMTSHNPQKVTNLKSANCIIHSEVEYVLPN